jgi:hypothetical protein
VEYWRRPSKTLVPPFSPEAVYPTLIFSSKPFQFECQHSILRQAIASAIVEDMAILDMKANQLEKSILGPISETATFLPSRHVVVIDTLDGCDSDDVASNVMNLFIPS